MSIQSAEYINQAHSMIRLTYENGDQFSVPEHLAIATTGSGWNGTPKKVTLHPILPSRQSQQPKSKMSGNAELLKSLTLTNRHTSSD